MSLSRGTVLVRGPPLQAEHECGLGGIPVGLLDLEDSQLVLSNVLLEIVIEC
jgi:hypothetical protein